MTARGIPRLAACTVALLCLGTTAVAGREATAQGGSVRGRVVVELGDIRVAELGPLVVSLEGTASTPPSPPPTATAVIHQREASFVPAFLVVAPGQTVVMPNDDTIFHNVFSYSKPNDFDLGLYGNGTSRTVTFHHPGVVRIYCSIHESMNGVIVVAPSPYFDTVDAAGAFEIRNVPPGTYRLRTWNERLPEAAAEVTVGAGETPAVEVRITEQDSSGPRDTVTFR
jgi:plastocyanin